MSLPADARPCHSPGVLDPAVRRPWGDDPRADDKDDLAAYVVENAYGVPVVRAARAVLGADTEAGDADHRLALRFYTEDYAHLFKTTRRDGLMWVEPRPAASHLKVSPRTSRKTDPDTANHPTGKGFLSGNAPTGTAADECRAVLRNRSQITPGADGVRAKIGHAFAAHRQGKDAAGWRGSRFTSTERASARQAAYLGALDAACDPTVVSGDVATHATLTPDRPGSEGDLVDVAASMNDDVDDLRRWLAYHTPGDGPADAVVLRETTNAGRLHLHVLVFGVAPQHLRDEGLGDYWKVTKNHGNVRCRRLVRRRTRDGRRWLAMDEGARVSSGTPIRAYLGGALADRRRVADLDAEALHEVATGRPRGGLDRWGLVQAAILWATGVEAFSASESLTGPSRRSEDSADAVDTTEPSGTPRARAFAPTSPPGLNPRRAPLGGPPSLNMAHGNALVRHDRPPPIYR
ncbi:MAG: hypothetical protein R6V31_08640 [Halohasta sp.]